MERCSINIVTFMCSAVYLPKVGISLFKPTLKNSMRGWCLRRSHVFPRGPRHVLKMETLGEGCNTEQPGKSLPLGWPRRTEEKDTKCTPE